MEVLIPSMYREYGLYKNKRQMLPNILDGLLPVQKRILLTAHTIAKNKFVKTYKVLGENMSRWHPHADAVGTAQWAVQNGFLIGDGQWGCNIGTDKTKCAAPRYTSLKMNDFVEDMAFTMVKSVKWEPDEADPEPIAIPTMIPFCLMTKYEISSIAFGFKAEIPCYKIEDLVKRLLYLTTGKNKVIIKPNIMGCDVTSTNKECENLLREGNGSISIQGKYKINKKNISIFGWSPRITFQTLFKRIDKYKGWNLLSKELIKYDDVSDQNGTRIDFEVIRKRGAEEIFEKMVEAVTENIKDNLTYDIVAISGDDIVTPSVDKMLLTTYVYYKDTLTKHLNIKIENLIRVTEELDIIKKIKPHISKLTKNGGNIDKSCELLASKTGCDVDKIKGVIDKYRIKKLLSISVDIKDIQNEIKQLKEDVKNVKDICYNRYNSLLE